MPPRPSCRRKALDLLARRPHFRPELAEKLARRGYEPAAIDAVLDRLGEEKLLDDAQLARDYVRSRLDREPLGPWRLRAELERRGVPAELAAEAIAASCPEDEEEALARQAAERWRRRSGTWSSAALARHLERRGFAQCAIIAVLSDLARQETDDPELVTSDDLFPDDL